MHWNSVFSVVANVLEAVMTHKFYLNVKSYRKWKAAKTGKNDGVGGGGIKGKCVFLLRVHAKQSENVHDLLYIQT